jgi:hypothetical protein
MTLTLEQLALLYVQLEDSGKREEAQKTHAHLLQDYAAEDVAKAIREAVEAWQAYKVELIGNADFSLF